MSFFVDSRTYMLLQSKNLSEEEKYNYMIELYHEYEQDRYYKRKYELYKEEDDLNQINYRYSKNETINKIDFLELYRAIKTLKYKHQLIVIMYYFEGFTQQEIADEFGITKQAVSKLIKRILVKLKEILKK